MSGRAKKQWSDAEDRRLVKLRREGKSVTAIAMILSRSVEGVRQRMLGIGLRGTVKLVKRKYADDEPR